MNKEEKLRLINEIFTPSSPVENIELFSGRKNELEEIRQAILEKGQHAVMFGPRGAGKTSLANMSRYFFEDLMVIKVTCNRNDDFKSIWDRALRKIVLVNPGTEIGYKPSEKPEIIPAYYPEDVELTPTAIENILTALDESILFIFDEFDIIKSIEAKTQMADMIKILSDNLPYISLLIVGIAQSVDKLIGEHHSIERCIRQIELPLMSENEAKELIKYNLNLIGLKTNKNIVDKIVELSSGFPNYLHLLCKHSANEAIKEEKNKIEMSHFNSAVIKSINTSDYSIRNAYHKATSSASGKNQFADVLLACAMANTDFENSFGSTEVLKEYNSITGAEHKAESINYNLGMLCKRERAEILTKLGRQKNARYRFRKPLLKAFVKLKQFEMEMK
jgi:energy-coupling factor transporter ATP-binding protein EcfA2